MKSIDGMFQIAWSRSGICAKTIRRVYHTTLGVMAVMIAQPKMMRRNVSTMCRITKWPNARAKSSDATRMVCVYRSIWFVTALNNVSTAPMKFLAARIWSKHARASCAKTVIAFPISLGCVTSKFFHILFFNFQPKASEDQQWNHHLFRTKFHCILLFSPDRVNDCGDNSDEEHCCKYWQMTHFKRKFHTKCE